MIAKVIATGETVFVSDYDVEYDHKLNSKIFTEIGVAKGQTERRSWTSNDLKFIDRERTTSKNIDWEQRRFELVKAAMQGVLNAISIERFTIHIEPSVVAEASIEYADAVIAKLKEK